MRDRLEAEITTCCKDSKVAEEVKVAEILLMTQPDSDEFSPKLTLKS